MSALRKIARRVRYRHGRAEHVDPSAPNSTVALGDSLTRGHTRTGSAVLTRDSYVDILAADGRIALVANHGKHGSHSAGVARRAPMQVPVSVARVMVLAGTNDLLRRPDLDTVEHLETIRTLIVERGAQAVFGLLPPIDSLPDQVRELNDRIRAWSAQYSSVVLADHWTALADEDGRYLPGMSTDGVHVTPAGARVMANQAHRAILRVPDQRAR